MTYLAFTLNEINVIHRRGKINDDDVVTFSVLVNQIERGRGATLFPDIPGGGGASILVRELAPSTGAGIDRNWVIGPLDIRPGDLVTIIYSGTNTSDSQLDLSGQAQIELKILDALTTAVVGAAGLGAIGSAISGALGFIGDPIGKLIGFEAQGPCNGTVFSDALQFTGDGLSGLAFAPLSEHASVLKSTLPGATEFFFTKSYSDEAHHDSNACGDVARTNVTFSVLRLPFISVRGLAAGFPGTPAPPISIRAFAHRIGRIAPSSLAFGLKQALGVV